MPPDLLEKVKVELNAKVKDPLKVSLVFIFIFFMFWGYSNFDLGWIMILSSLSECLDRVEMIFPLRPAFFSEFCALFTRLVSTFFQ